MHVTHNTLSYAHITGELFIGDLIFIDDVFINFLQGNLLEKFRVANIVVKMAPCKTNKFIIAVGIQYDIKH